ncbi:MAG: bifunctional glutamate N-acetyltransferase/amino-acid acetyltransferase ArgJ [Candidatus Omnitrophica bacterium]|nr:bifunctional glutamate N-acetyltransferase/amino-acid acetyltransferase ArgJ [Candidatus Omnitrophota bacterium]
MKVLKKAILPIGFKASGIASGIKKSGKLDLALFYSDLNAKAACQFTANKIQAAPIMVSKRHLKESSNFKAIIVNSGNANCFTGQMGLKDSEETTQFLAEALDINKQNCLVASTGIIGRRLPLLKIKEAMPYLISGLSRSGIGKAKLAIMTTDTFAKEITVSFNIGKSKVTICGVAKGAGMIAPNMATMLAFLLTDANITKRALNKALEVSMNHSFNCITVDGCMSTNDSVMVLSNGAAKNKLIDINRHFNLFSLALNTICLELAKSIIKDAEGASKFIQIKVDKAKSFKEARHVGLAIANSNLFKTAMYGENPNFGRIVAAIGASGIEVKEKDLKIKVSPLDKKNINIEVSINRGNSSAVVYTSDLTEEYIKINAAYN